MIAKEFINSIANGQIDVIQRLLDILNRLEIAYCVVGGLAVNAYVEPVVSLDLDLVVATASINKLKKETSKLFSQKEFPHSLNLTSSKTDLRIQIQTDPRYQGFINSAVCKKVLGYDMYVAAVEDVLQGKLWAYLDGERRLSKRQKDLADIFRLVEEYPYLEDKLPEPIKSRFLED